MTAPPPDTSRPADSADAAHVVPAAGPYGPDDRLPVPCALPPHPARRELLGVLLVFLVGLVLRLGYAPTGGLDRGMDGFQGAFFALTSVNYERLGTDAVGGYPVVNVDPVADAPGTWYVYANHSPLLSLALWANLAAFAPDVTLPDGTAVPWGEAWRHGLPPTRAEDEGFEDVLRMPMFLASLATLLALWWALRAFGGPDQALVGMALYAVAPLAVLEAGLVNYEPPSILCVVLAFGFLARWQLAGRRAHLAGALAFVALGTAQTFAPLFFAVPLCAYVLLTHARRGGALAGARAVTPFAAAALLPILAHGALARRAMEGIGEVPRLTDRVALLFEPLTSGAVPLWSWVQLQFSHLGAYNSALVVDLTLLGIVFAVIELLAAPSRGEVDGEEQEERAARAHGAGLTLLLFVSGFAVLFFYYKHTADGFLPGTSAQDTFMLNLLPGASALGGLALVQFGRTLHRILTKGRTELSLLRRHGATLALSVIGAVTLNVNVNAMELHWLRWRAPAGPGQGPLPKVTGARLAEVVPAGAVGLYPEALGWTPAVGLYAWRTLLPVSDDLASFEFATVRIAEAGLAERPRYLLLPTDPPESARPQVEAMRGLFAELFPRIAARPPAEAEGWQAWELVD